MGPALLLLALHYIWVIRADTAFEEAAAEASLLRARQVSAARRGAGLPSLAHRRLPPLFRLAPVGWRGGALLWKNLLAVVRTRRARNMAVAFVVGAVAAGALSFQGDGTVAEIAGWLATTWAALSLVIGPQWIRNDLRSDLLKLDLLRSYPLPGRSVVAAETAASTVVLTCLQLGLLLVAYIAFIGVPDLDPPLDLRTAVLAAAVVCLPGINFLGMLIHNGTALLFPAWVHLGSNRPGGVEALGPEHADDRGVCGAPRPGARGAGGDRGRAGDPPGSGAWAGGPPCRRRWCCWWASRQSPWCWCAGWAGCSSGWSPSPAS